MRPWPRRRQMPTRWSRALRSASDWSRSAAPGSFEPPRPVLLRPQRRPRSGSGRPRPGARPRGRTSRPGLRRRSRLGRTTSARRRRLRTRQRPSPARAWRRRRGGERRPRRAEHSSRQTSRLGRPAAYRRWRAAWLRWSRMRAGESSWWSAQRQTALTNTCSTCGTGCCTQSGSGRRPRSASMQSDTGPESRRWRSERLQSARSLRQKSAGRWQMLRRRTQSLQQARR
mmetsp:Transcript_15261/g.43673  ORF Transcript_15261/g.43673 Transcript_15261/m.43673 type:complete len:228 (+) Transcript_15261:250-933(+)